jgi:hypothetical protein
MAAGVFLIEDVKRRHADVEQLFLVEAGRPHLGRLRYRRSIRGAARGVDRAGDRQ